MYSREWAIENIFRVFLLSQFPIFSLYEHSSRQTMITCARMFPDVQPWEVMEICRQSSSLTLESGSANFVFYVEQLMRWRAEDGNTEYEFLFNLHKL